MRKKKICLYIGSLQRGGAERVLGNLAVSLFEAGYAVTIVTSYFTPPEYELPHALWDCATGKALPGADPEEGIRRVYSEIPAEEITGSRLGNFRRRFLRLRSIWKEEGADLVVAFIGKCNLMAVLTTRGLGIPAAVSVRALPSEEYPGRAMRLLANLVFPMASAVILQARGAYPFFSKAVQRRAVTLKNPLNPAFLSQEIPAVREHAIALVGRLDSNKDQALALRAFAGLKDEFPDWRVWIFGDGPDREALEELARSLGIRERCDFAGNVDDVAGRLARASVFVLTSRTEGAPNALLEAMSLGLACISTDCPVGVPGEVIRDGENGLLVPVGAAEALREKLSLVMGDAALRERLGKNALPTGRAYAPEIVFAEWQTVLASLMEKRV